jgi:hypothetical protein
MPGIFLQIADLAAIGVYLLLNLIFLAQDGLTPPD